MPLGLLVLVGVLAVNTAQFPPGRAINPHWLKDACDKCHVMKNGQAQPTIPLPESEQSCLSCHDSVHAKAEAHPVGRLLDPEQFRHPGWPLLEGRLACATCHDISLTRGHKNAQTAPSEFLRPAQAQGPDAFCASCHKPVDYSRINPHRMMTEGHVVPADCLLCHKQLADNQAMTRTGRPDLRTDVMMLCRSCHYYHVDWYEPGHMGAKVPAKMVAYMRAKEIVGPTTRPSRQMVAELQATGTRPEFWPVGPENTLVCMTCHNPHQQGVFPPGSVLAVGAMKIENGRVVSSIETPGICLRCHNL